MVDTSHITVTRGEDVEVATVRLFDREVGRMSDRQLNDLRVGFLLLRAAMMPDVFFDGHPAAEPDSVDSMMDRIAILAALDDVHGLPERA